MGAGFHGSAAPPGPAERAQRFARAAEAPAVKRAVVLSGGGAKGVFESGVLHAFWQIDLEPHVITGSSVGAINAIAYAEAIRVRRERGEEAGCAVMERGLELWQRLDVDGVADIDRTLGLRVRALSALALIFGLTLVGFAFLGGLGRGAGDFALRLVALLVGAGLGALGLALLRWWGDLPRALRAHVRRGLVKPDPEIKTISVDRLLRWAGLWPSVFSNQGLRRALTRILPETRRLSEYEECGLDVRLTRTNVRTGRTEVSECLTPAEASLPGIDRGRRVLGDPRALDAALASSAFPTAFPPLAAVSLYPEAENPLLYATLGERARAKRELNRVFGDKAKSEYLWLADRLDEWSEREPELLKNGSRAELVDRMRSLFYGERKNWSRVPPRYLLCLAETRQWPELPVTGEPRYSDRYFDGGILDNTPLSAALAALKDADARRRESRAPGAAAEDITAHEMFVVLLAPRPRSRYLAAEEAERLDGPALGMRALRLQAERRLADDIRNAERIDRLLAEKGLAEASLAGLMHKAGAGKPPESERSTGAADGAAVGRLPAGSWAEVLAREGGARSVPGAHPSAEASAPAAFAPAEHLVRVRVTRVYPSWDLPWLLALDDRLGFDADLAREFQARGCRDALGALSDRYAPGAKKPEPLPPHARAVRRLIGGSWDEPPRSGWVCRAEVCSLRSACDRVARRDAADARAAGMAAASST